MAGKGYPRKFATADDFVNKAKEYIIYCIDKDRLPNIAGFAVYCDMNVDTYYAQKDYYSEAYKEVETMLEDAVINGKANDTMKIFYMKNKFNYRDKQEIESNVNLTYEDKLKEMTGKDEY